MHTTKDTRLWMMADIWEVWSGAQPMGRGYFCGGISADTRQVGNVVTVPLACVVVQKTIGRRIKTK